MSWRRSGKPMPSFSSTLCVSHGGSLAECKSLLLIATIWLLWVCPSHALGGVVGVTYRHENDPNYPDPPTVARALANMRIPRVRLINPSPSTVAAFAGTGIELSVTVEERGAISILAANRTAAAAWVQDMVRGPALPAARANVTSISIGYNVLLQDPTLWDAVNAALTNVRAACDRLPFPFRVSVSSASSFDVVGGAIPSSGAAFRPELLGRMKTLLAFLNDTGSPFQVDIFPFLILRTHSKEATMDGLDLAFATMSTNPDNDDAGLLDRASGLRYLNLFDLMIDAVITALTKAGYEDMSVEVVGTGWPHRLTGRMYDPDASLLNAAEYNERLIRRLLSDPGTPLRPYETSITYIHSVFDANFNAGEEGEIKNYMGFMGTDTELRYNIAFVNEYDSGTLAPGAGGGVTSLWMLLVVCFFL